MSFYKTTQSFIRPILTIPVRGVKATAPRIKIGPMKYVPPPDSNPCLVRPESILKSIVLEDPTRYPISLKRLDDIRNSPKGWVPRKVPPPELPFEFKRNGAKRFDVKTHYKRSGGRMLSYTTVSNIKGDFEKFKDCLKWRFGEKVPIKIFYSNKTIVVVGHYPRDISVLIQALGF